MKNILATQSLRSRMGGVNWTAAVLGLSMVGSALWGVWATDKLLALDFDTVIPGHGPILTKDEVRTFRRNLQTVLDRVQGQIEAGATRDNIASRIDTNDLGWPLAPVRLQDVYDELTAAR